VRPIDEMDVYRRFYALSLLASAGVAIDGIAEAQPPGGSGASQQRAVDPRSLEPGIVDERLGGLGSNAYGLGRDATASGHGLLFGNPHFPWQGSERFYQSHLTIPGKVDVMGGSLLGVPIALIGTTKGLAWSHTVSTARRFVPYEVQLVPGQPTKYVVDGQQRDMRADKVTVRTKDGTVTRTLWSTEHGPILNGILGLPIFPWTNERAYALYDANADNFGRLLNHFFDFNHAQTVDEAEAILKRYQGIPWVNTIAADTKGDALYADIGSIPHVTEDKRAACTTELGAALDAAQRLIVLDGSREACKPGTDPDALQPGIFGPSRMPLLRRTDHVSNMNDSYWLTHPEQRLEGFPRIIGDERTARSLRTRVGLRIIQDRLAGKDGLPGTRFDAANLRELVFRNRVLAGELWRDELVPVCRTTPGVPAEACDVLAKWDLRDDLDSKGSILFRRFFTRFTGATPVGVPQAQFSRQYDNNDPVGTPSGLNTANPLVRDALRQAVADVQGAGLPLDAGMREGQTVTRRGEKIPVQGGLGSAGVFNVITPVWDAAKGYTEVVHGTSYVQVVDLQPGCPRASTLVTYGQSTDPDSPRTSDQTKLFAEKRWVTPPFCGDAVDRDPDLVRDQVTERPQARWIRSASIREAKGRSRPRLDLTLARRAAVRITITQGRSKRRIRRTLPAGSRDLLPRVRRGAYRVTIVAGKDVVTLRARQR
jgi:acyl-homoserine-lactone acylase